MKTLEIPVKFIQGDIVYTTKQIKVEKTCNVCEGKKTIKYNDKDMRCPECMGAGKFTSDKVTNVVIEEPFEIRSIKIATQGNGDISTIKYKGVCGFVSLNRAEDNLFSTKEEAQKRCNELNKEKAYVKISDIIIKDCFRATQPSLEKIQKKLEYYQANSKFDKNIVVDKNYVLQDGYITYLLCGLLGKDIARVTIEDVENILFKLE